MQSLFRISAPAVIACTGAFAGYSFASDVGSFPSEDGRYVAVVREVDGEPKLSSSSVTSVLVLIKSATQAAAAEPVLHAGPPAPSLKATGLSFQARMPEHGHGMPLKPEVTQSAPDEFLVRGVKMPMPGSREVTIEAKVGPSPVRFRIPLTL